MNPSQASMYIEEYGCSANRADSEVLAGILAEAGFKIVDTPAQSDLNIIVTCTVKDATYQRMVTRIKALAASAKPMIVAGCMPKTSRATILRLSPKTSLLGPNYIDLVKQAAENTLSGVRVEYLGDTHNKLLQPRILRNPVVGVVQIASGCLSACAFCQVKLARGVLKSYGEDLILSEIDRLVKRGCKEIWLTSQDNGCYGKDNGSSIADLLDKVSRLQGGFMVRVGMMNPTHIIDDIGRIVDILRCERFFKFLHIPVQSGSNKVLHHMRRGYTKEAFLSLVKEARQRIPQLTLSTDIIVGYPTETESDFMESLSLIEEVEPDIVNISRFSPRPGTRAALLPQLPLNVVKQRSSTMHSSARRIAYERNKLWLGWRGEALVDEDVRGAKVARNPFYKPIVVDESAALGSYQQVKVKNVTAACLYAVMSISGDNGSNLFD